MQAADSRLTLFLLSNETRAFTEDISLFRIEIKLTAEWNKSDVSESTQYKHTQRVFGSVVLSFGTIQSICFKVSLGLHN